MEPAPATGFTLAPSPQADLIHQTPSPPPQGPPRKIRSDAKLEQLSPARRERLRFWLEDENRTYAEVVALLRAEFNLTVGKSAVALYWRRHLMPQRHAEESEIAAVLAALPAAAFDAAILNQARVLAWSALARPEPQVQDAVILLAAIHRAERLALARQRLALAERRLALASRRSLGEGGESRRSLGEGGPSASARHQTAEPSSPRHSLGEGGRLPRRSLGEGGQPSPKTPDPIPPLPHAMPPRFPGYSGLLQPPAGPAPVEGQPQSHAEQTLAGSCAGDPEPVEGRPAPKSPVSVPLW